MGLKCKRDLGFDELSMVQTGIRGAKHVGKSALPTWPERLQSDRFTEFVRNMWCFPGT